MRQELIIIALLGSLFGCSDDGVLLAPDPVDRKRSGSGETTAQDVTSLAGTGWVLAFASIGAPPLDDLSRIALKFSDQRLSAVSGCNTSTGGYRLEGNALVVEAMASTMMGCVGPVQAWENAFFAFLRSKPLLTRAGDEIVLESGGGRLGFRSMPLPSANAVRKLIYVASERQSCTGVAPMMCLQVREQPTEPWRLHYGEIVGFTHQTGIEYRLRILEDLLPNPPADSSSTRWFLDLVVEQRVVHR